MSMTYGFFNAQQVNGDYDRKYGADELAEYFASLIGNGISADITNCFKITATSGMQISIAAGYAWINGYWVKNDTPVTRTLAVAPSSNSRVDSVVLRFSKADRSIELFVVQGDVSSTPSFKPLTRTTDTYELMLGYVAIPAGASAITSSMIIDTRSNETYCGIISTFSQKAIPDGSITFVKLAADAVKLQFTDVVVAKTAFVADSTYQDYPYRAAVPLTGVLSSMIPDVTLSLADATSGNFAPVTACYDGGIYLYAASVPDAAITVPTILCWKGNA